MSTRMRCLVSGSPIICPRVARVSALTGLSVAFPIGLSQISCRISPLHRCSDLEPRITLESNLAAFTQRVRRIESGSARPNRRPPEPSGMDHRCGPSSCLPSSPLGPTALGAAAVASPASATDGLGGEVSRCPDGVAVRRRGRPAPRDPRAAAGESGPGSRAGRRTAQPDEAGDHRRLPRA